MTQDEGIGTQFLLDAHDMQLMKDTVARRKDKAVLAGVAGLQKPLIKKKWKRNDRNGRGRGSDNRNEESQSRERDNKGDDGKNEASQGSKDGSSHKSTSTQGKAKGKFQQGRASKYAAFRSLCAGQPV